MAASNTETAGVILPSQEQEQSAGSVTISNQGLESIQLEIEAIQYSIKLILKNITVVAVLVLAVC